MTNDRDKLNEILARAARLAEADGVPIDGAFDGAVHHWAQQHVTYRPDQEFFVVFLLTAEMADRQARRDGFANQAELAASRVDWNRNRQGAAPAMQPR